MVASISILRYCCAVLALATHLAATTQHRLSQQVASQDLPSRYPADLTYTQHHIWFRADPEINNLTRIGTTSYAISHFLRNNIDGGAIYPDRNDSVSAGEVIGRFIGATDDEVLEVKAPFAAVFHAPNLDLDLDAMVDWPYGDQGFLALLRGSVPGSGEGGISFMGSKEYERFVENL